MTGSYVSDAQYRQNVLFIGVLRPSDYRITGLHPKLCAPSPKRSFFLIFMIIHKYLYI